MGNLRGHIALNIALPHKSGNEGRDCLCVQEEPVVDEPPAEVKEEDPADADADAELDSAAVKDEEGDDEGEAAAAEENDEENEDPLAGMNKHAATYSPCDSPSEAP